MKTQAEPIDIKEDIMIPIYLSNGSFEANEELIHVIQRTALVLGLSTVNDLRAVTEEAFFEIFTPLMNAHYGLK
ncbi:hypothetical protein [Dyadobacter psychrotolerans]|uniref:Uncharacterized protein n=1 Tax=Dyadobacter psychrotolerans TaxID=2541721 RepID=A0A4R5D7N9_9BACT|nr:hypothetical protein [Dyadobacter psychrotolerans]TDE08687.1 hypothetical protein E0F88_32165 [Dyadobacter psychrotolerans]